MIRHAAACTVGALAVAVVEAAFGAALVTRVGGADGAQTGGAAARIRAVDVAAITRCADGERLATLAAGALAE